MLQPSPLKKSCPEIWGGKGLLSKQRENFCFIVYDLFTTALSRVPTVTTLLGRILNHLDLKVFSSGCSQHAFPQIDFWRTLSVQGYQPRQAYQHTLVSLTE